MKQSELFDKAKPYLKNRDKVYITGDGHVFLEEHLGDAQSHANTHKQTLYQVNDKEARMYGDKEYQSEIQANISPEIPELKAEAEPEKATTAIIEIDGEEVEMTEDEIRTRLTELKVKIRINTGIVKLAAKLNKALND